MAVGNADETTQVDPRPPIGREAHDFPLVLEFLKSQPPRKLGIKQTNRIRPPDHLNESELAPFTMPDRGRLPGTSPVDHHHSRLVEPGNRIGAQGVGIMVVDSLEAVFRCPQMPGEKALAIRLIFQDPAHSLRFQGLPPSHWMRAGQIVSQISGAHSSERLPSESYLVEML